jgi:hypothetical protein
LWTFSFNRCFVRINDLWALSVQACGFAPAEARQPGGLAVQNVAVLDALPAQVDTAVQSAAQALGDIVASIVSPLRGAADSCFAAAQMACAQHFLVASSGDSELPAPDEIPAGCCR